MQHSITANSLIAVYKLLAIHLAFPNGTTGKLTACYPHCPVDAERQAVKLQILNKSHWFYPTLNKTSSLIAMEADALSTWQYDPCICNKKTYTTTNQSISVFILAQCNCWTALKTESKKHDSAGSRTRFHKS